MMQRIIVINGEAGCGKDTFVDIIEEANHGRVMQISAITPIKAMADIAGWDGEKTPKSRKFLSDLKDLCDEAFNTSRNYIRREVDVFRSINEYDFLFIHARDPEQIAWIVREFGARTLLIKRDGYTTKASNHADANIYNFSYDYEVRNAGDDMNLYRAIAASWLYDVVTTWK